MFCKRGILSFMVFLATIELFQSTCGHNILKKTSNNTIFIIKGEKDHRCLQENKNKFENIRINFIIYEDKSIFKDLTNYFDIKYLIKTIELSVARIEQLITVFRGTGVDLSNVEYCHNYKIKKHQRFVYDNTDFIIFLNLINQQNLPLAGSLACVMDEKYYFRPVASYMYINLAKINKKEVKLLLNSELLQHEIIHSLGFDFDILKKFSIDKSGNNHNIFLKSQDHIDRNLNRFYINNKKTVDFAKKHFNCSLITKVPLEDYGDNDSALSHLESTFFFDELMAPSNSLSSMISNVSLSILEASGWYSPKYELITEDNYWGKDKGCDFFFKTCLNNTNFDEFCDIKSNKTHCTFDHLAEGICFKNKEINYNCAIVNQFYDKICDRSSINNKDQINRCLITPYNKAKCMSVFCKRFSKNLKINSILNEKTISSTSLNNVLNRYCVK